MLDYENEHDHRTLLKSELFKRYLRVRGASIFEYFTHHKVRIQGYSITLPDSFSVDSYYQSTIICWGHGAALVEDFINRKDEYRSKLIAEAEVENKEARERFNKRNQQETVNSDVPKCDCHESKKPMVSNGVSTLAFVVFFILLFSLIAIICTI